MADAGFWPSADRCISCDIGDVVWLPWAVRPLPDADGDPHYVAVYTCDRRHTWVTSWGMLTSEEDLRAMSADGRYARPNLLGELPKTWPDGTDVSPEGWVLLRWSDAPLD